MLIIGKTSLAATSKTNTCLCKLMNECDTCLLIADLCSANGGRTLTSPLSDLDQLTAPTLTPQGVSRGPPRRPPPPPPPPVVKREEKLTIITPSSVVPTTTTTTKTIITRGPRPQWRPLTTRTTTTSSTSPGTRTSVNSNQESISHSVSVVSVKYSSTSVDKSEGKKQPRPQENIEKEEVASLKKSFTTSTGTTSPTSSFTSSTRIPSTSKTTTTKSPTKSETSARVPKGTQVVAEDEDDDRGPKSIASIRILSGADEDKKEVVFKVSSSASAAPNNDSDSQSLTSVEVADTLKYEHVTDATSQPLGEVVNEEDVEEGIPDLVDERDRKEGEPTTVKKYRSETERALDELGFEYNEYIDDSDLLGDESNDEVIPPFNDIQYESPSDTEDSPEAAEPRAIKVETGSEDNDGGNRKHVVHEYEASTVIGITVGAFLLIFIGTGKKMGNPMPHLRF